MNVEERYVNNRGVNIHVMEANRGTKDGWPLVVIPGLAEASEDYREVVEKLYPRHCVVITLRGRGRSDAPASGYTLNDHVSDIEAAIEELELRQFVLMGFSRGVAYTLGYAVQHPDRIQGLIIGDYPAVHTRLKPGWVEFFSSLPPWRGKPLSERMSTGALHALQQESDPVVLWERLPSLHCPVLIIRGGTQGAALSAEAAEQYREMLPQAEIVVFEESDHNIFEPDPNVFIQAAERFMNGIRPHINDMKGVDVG
ncbi:alpha/beta hydrolase [Paenibacillus thiaminolyticus]|uniref:alpha/beta fold hydrolase n=1 Tax=Paenibacillus TaxID=44249 RepID=UPI00105A845A|nr:alpha/beta hydrolase [Paenibacillus dendritiformis]TDL52988.1 alpha/beta hydrolase [Paenibacillus dendritiformis]